MKKILSGLIAFVLFAAPLNAQTIGPGAGGASGAAGGSLKGTYPNPGLADVNNIATSLAVGGATIGGNSLAVAGSAAISGNLALGTGAFVLSSPSSNVFQPGGPDVSSGAPGVTVQFPSNTGAATTGPDTIFVGTGGLTAGGSIIFKTKATTTAAAALTIAPSGTITQGIGGSGAAATNFILDGSNGSGTGAYITFRAGGAAKGYIGRSAAVIGSGSDDSLALVSNAALGINFYVNSTTFAGAFSSSGLLQFAGTTSSSPALKRSSAILQARLADDSAYAAFEASTLRAATAFTVGTLPTVGTAGRFAYVTDAVACTFLASITGGGATVCPVFDNGTAWVGG